MLDDLKALFNAQPIYLDTETTGLVSPEILELAVVHPNGEGLTWRFRPLTPIDAAAQAIHGIGHHDLQNCPFFHAWAQDLHLLLCGETVVTWGDLDLRAITHTAYLHRSYNPAYGSLWIDGMSVYQRAKGRDGRISLRRAAEEQSVVPHRAHSALGDAQTMRDVLLSLYREVIHGE